MRTAPILSPIKSPFPTPPTPPTTLLEGFESFFGNLPSDGPLSWEVNQGVFTLAASALHVTQGVHSGIFSGTGIPVMRTTNVDLTGKNKVFIDVTITALGDAGSFFQLSVTGHDPWTAQTPPDTLGTFTLAADITADSVKSNMIIAVILSSSILPMTAYIDNLRVS